MQITDSNKTLQSGGLLTPTQTALLLQVSAATLAAWRVRGNGPLFLKLGGGRTALIRYRRSALDDYLVGQEREPALKKAAPDGKP